MLPAREIGIRERPETVKSPKSIRKELKLLAGDIRVSSGRSFDGRFLDRGEMGLNGRLYAPG